MEQDASSDHQTFVLDLASNPHPRLRGLANAARHNMADTRADMDIGYWRGIVDSMIAATGCAEDDILDWLARDAVSG